MLERLLLAGTVTCLLYFSVQVGRSSVNPTQTNQPFGYVKFESSSLPDSRGRGPFLPFPSEILFLVK